MTSTQPGHYKGSKGETKDQEVCIGGFWAWAGTGVSHSYEIPVTALTEIKGTQAGFTFKPVMLTAHVCLMCYS